MKSLILLIAIFLTAPVHAQKLFHSPYTQHWPTMFTTEYEETERSISIGNEEIIIISESEKGKEVQTLSIEDIEVNQDHIAYRCSSRDGRNSVSLILPLKKTIRHIDLYHYSEKTGEEVQTRFLIDYYYK